MKHPVLLLAILSLLLGCSKSQEPAICHGIAHMGRIAVGFKGYAKADLDTIITERYARGSNFSQLVDTFIVSDSNVFILHDTTLRENNFLNTIYKGFADLDGNYDYKIVLPSSGRSYRITEISFPVDSAYSYSVYNSGCPDSLSSRFRYCTGLKVDTQTVIPSRAFEYPCCSLYSSVSLLYLKI